MIYEWTRAGVAHAVEDVMREHPELEQRFWVNERRDPDDFTWHVELDPDGECRVARLTWQMIAHEQREEIASAIAEAEPRSAAAFA
jgi:hypothetical protein